MPELPEVETVRDGLARHVLGRRVRGAAVHHPRATRRHAGGGPDLAARLTGRTLTAAVRRGKYLWLVLDDDAEALLVHLGMSGQLLVEHPRSADSREPRESRTPSDSRDSRDSRISHSHVVVDPPLTAAPGVPPDLSRHLRAEFDLSDGARLAFVDQRTFGHLLLTDLVPTADGAPGGHGSPLAALPAEVAHIARDPLDPTVDLAAVARRMRSRRTEVKRALLDQTLVSGIGNIYADEALWRAQVHPRRSTDKLPQRVAVEVLTAATDVMREALAAGGTSFDELYVDVDGAAGYFSRSLDAYGRAGLPCRRCGALIRRETFMNRSSAFCPRCQRAPRG